MEVSVNEMIRQMEEVRGALEQSSDTAPLASLIGDWIKGVESMREKAEAVTKGAEDVHKAVLASIEAAKGYQIFGR